MTVSTPEVAEASSMTISVQEATALSLSMHFGFAPEEIAIALDISAQEAGEALERAAMVVA